MRPSPTLNAPSRVIPIQFSAMPRLHAGRITECDRCKWHDLNKQLRTHAEARG